MQFECFTVGRHVIVEAAVGGLAAGGGTRGGLGLAQPVALGLRVRTQGGRRRDRVASRGILRRDKGESDLT